MPATAARTAVAGSGTATAVNSTPFTGRATMPPPTRVSEICGFDTVGVKVIDGIPKAESVWVPRRFVTVPFMAVTTVAPLAEICTLPPPAANPWLEL